MKKKSLVIALAMVLGIGMVGTGNMDVFAATNDGVHVEGATPKVEEVDPTLDLTGGSATFDTDIDYSGRDNDIVYDLQITVGAMVFHYDYGSEWNATTHCYENKTSKTVGWQAADRDGTNNKITIVNNSNYPVSVDVTYANVENGNDSYFNKNYFSSETASMVHGYLSDSNATTDWDSIADAVTAAVAAGNTMPATLTAKAQSSFQLDTDTSNIAAGVAGPYWTLASPGTATYQKILYFAYFGTPDKGMTDQEGAGKITVAIKPVASSATTAH